MSAPRPPPPRPPPIPPAAAAAEDGAPAPRAPPSFPPGGPRPPPPKPATAGATSDSSASGGPRPPPPKPPAAAPAQETVGGFAVGLLDKAKEIGAKNADKGGDDDDDDDEDEWRTTEEDLQKEYQSREAAKVSSGLKAAIAKPPSNPKAPPKPPSELANAAPLPPKPAAAPPLVAPPSTSTAPAATSGPTPPPSRSTTPPSRKPSEPRSPGPPASSSTTSIAAVPPAVTPAVPPAAPPAVAKTPYTPAPSGGAGGSAPATAVAATPGLSTSAAARIKELEEDVAALNGKLVRAHSRIADLQASGKGSAESKSHILREQELEKELDSAQDRIRKAAQENKSLNATVSALRQQLTAAEAKKDFGSSDLGALAANALAAGVKRAQERDPLKDMLFKAKQEKDKAVRALIHIIGKDKVAAFLHKNAGAPNILDLLLEQFSGSGSSHPVTTFGDSALSLSLGGSGGLSGGGGGSSPGKIGRTPPTRAWNMV